MRGGMFSIAPLPRACVSRLDELSYAGSCHLYIPASSFDGHDTAQS
jgi:hypothetical protein